MKKQIFFLLFSILTYYSFGQVQNTLPNNMLSDVDKTVGLSKCWSETKYNYVYYDKLTFDWDSLYQATIPVVLATKNDFEYYRELQRFVAVLQDGHTIVSSDNRTFWNNWATIPIRTRLIDGKMIVIDVLNDELRLLYGVKRGLEIVKINGINVEKYVSDNIKPFVFSSTEQWLNLIAYGREATRGKKSESICLTFKGDNNRLFDTTISHSMPEEQSQPKALFDFTILENNIGLLKIGSFWHDDYAANFDSIYKKVLATNALIIDIRGNGGGSSNNSKYILSHLTNQGFEMTIWSSPRYIPAFASWNHSKEWYVSEPSIVEPIKNKPFYDKPVALIIDEGTFSAAEDFCVGFRNMKRGSIIGTPSGGSTGNSIVFDLPGNGSIQICTKKDTYPDGTEFVGVGILPDVEVRETVSSFLSKAETGVDNTNAMLKAVEIIKKSLKTE